MAEEASVSSDAQTKQERRTRQRFARRQWARRWLALRYVVALLAVVLLAAGGTWLVLFSDYLSVHEVKVSGAEILTTDEVVAAANVPAGEQLARVELERVKSRVAALAEVETVDVTREWPDAVRITIVERTPVAVVKIGGTWRGLDATGTPFRAYARPPRNLPQVHASANAQTDALQEAALVVSSMPAELAAKVDHVEVETIDRISLALRSGRTVQWGSSEESALKAEVLLKLLSAHEADSYDVSVPGNPTAG